MTSSIFIVGAGRSGTKYLMNMLNNSDVIHIVPEIHFFSLFHSGFRKNLRKKYKRVNGEYSLDDVVNCITHDNHFGTYWRRESRFSEDSVREWFSDKRVTEENIYKFLVDIDRVIHAPEKNVMFSGEKALYGVFHLAKLLAWFPGARIIYIYRDPLAVLRSEVNKGSKPDYPLSKGNPLYPYGLVFFVFMIWVAGAISVLMYKRTYKSVCVVSYDELIRSPGNSMKRLADECGFPYTDELTRVARVDSSFGNMNEHDIWVPPSWVRALYSVFLQPVRAMLYKRSIHCTC